jgi:hypothetical protein
MRSEITKLKERLRLEAASAFLGLHGYAQVAQHQIIHQNMQRVEQTFQQLVQYVGEEEAELVLVDGLEQACQKEGQYEKNELFLSSQERNKVI